MTTSSPSPSLALADQRTDLLSSLGSSSRLPAPLTEADATRITAVATAAYAQAWSRWVHWCAGRGLVPFPAEPAVVCAYLTERAEEGVSLSTIDQACSAIGHQHRHTPWRTPSVMRRFAKSAEGCAGSWEVHHAVRRTPSASAICDSSSARSTAPLRTGCATPP